MIWDSLDAMLVPCFRPPPGAPPHRLVFDLMSDLPTGWETISVQGGAIFSTDEEEIYRYALWRVWDPSLPLDLYGMLNPSKATHLDGDNTVDRQMERSRRNGAGGILVGNSAALRETDRLKAIRHHAPVGPDNLYWLIWLASLADRIILAHGPDAAKWGGDSLMAEAFHDKELFALKITKNGTPGHPLYVGYDAPLIPFNYKDMP